MSGTELFLDTNIVLYLMRGDESLANIVDGKKLYVSFITELELLSFGGITEPEQAKIEAFLNDPNVEVVDINKSIKIEVITLKREVRIKLPDSIIAATAIYKNVPLLSADSDFTRVTSLSLLHYNVNQ